MWKKSDLCNASGIFLTMLQFLIYKLFLRRDESVFKSLQMNSFLSEFSLVFRTSEFFFRQIPKKLLLYNRKEINLSLVLETKCPVTFRRRNIFINIVFETFGTFGLQKLELFKNSSSPFLCGSLQKMDPKMVDYLILGIHHFIKNYLHHFFKVSF